MIYKLESIKDNLTEILNLVASYWKESDERRNIDDGKIDVETYLRLEESSLAYILTARNDEGNMVGFILYTVTTCIHTDIAKASAELFFVTREYRNGNVALGLLSEWEEVTPEESYLFFTLKTEFPHERLISVTGYCHVENIFMKRNRNGSSDSSSNTNCSNSRPGE
ncbi:MAG: hypothetical protein JKY81_02315 [Colwellia sp.]|nr:hypothetical protein [Colwellia sp.]